ncbi:MAG TPA: CoA transferase [Acidimicrobiales bacterium]|nr:CoA transferase [Acidimicrobiales bacterium]
MLDCSRGTAGMRCTGMLADYGADVVWIEPPGGDPCRRHTPAAMSVFNRGKRSVEVDLTVETGRATVLDLAERADVFVESWAPGTADRLGLGYDALHARHPGLVYVSISGFGEDGGDAGLPGYEAIVHAVLGSMSEQAAHRDGPVFIGCPFAAMGAAYLALIGALAALFRRHQDGFGRHVRTSLIDGALAYHSMLWGESDQAIAAGTIDTVQQTASTRLITRSFECGDGEYLGLHTGAVGAFGRAMEVLGIDDRVPPSETGLDMGLPLAPEHLPIIADEVPRIFRSRARAEWVRRFLSADVCAIEHLRPTECYDTPQVVHNDMVIEVEDPVIGPVRQVGLGAKFSASPGAVQGPAPLPGQHTAAVLADVAGWPRREPVERPLVPDGRPLLDGLRVLDLGAYYAGPYSSRLLADLGADVIKVEPVLGDQMRGIERPFFSAQANKRAIAANLKHPGLARAAAGLLAWADVVHHNLRPGAADRLGLDYARAREVNPAIVYLYAPGWGATGPFAMRQSFAPMMSGYVGVTFEVAGLFNPPLPPAANEDPGNGLLGAVAVLLALLHRQRTGHGQYVENPQLNATMAHTAHIVRRPDGEVIGAGRLDPLQMGWGAFERLYEAADGMVCIVAYDDADRAAAVATLGVARVADDERQSDAIMEAVRGRGAADVVAALRANGVAAAIAVGRNMRAFMHDPEQRRLGRVSELPHAAKGNVRELAALVRVSGAAQVPHRLAPELGQDTDAILAELGYTAEEIGALRADHAVR